MKPLNALIFGFVDLSEAIYALEEKNVIKIIDAYYLNEHFTWRYEEIILNSHDVDFSYEYHISYDLYQKIHKKYFADFLANMNRFESYTGHSLPHYDHLSIFKRCINYAYNKLLKNNIQILIHSAIPHEVIDYTFYIIAKEIGIKRILTLQLFEFEKNFLYLMDEASEFGMYKTKKEINSIKEIDPSVFLKAREAIKNTGNSQLHNESVYERLKIVLHDQHIMSKDNHRRHTEQMNILKSIIKKDLPENIKYIYAPLHFQPEMSTMGMAKILWDDQATLIEFIAAKLPEDVYIITKEHWLQSFHQRSDLFYQRLAETKKVIFAPIETPSSILLEGALAAATTTGTVGWEALASKKPVIYAGYPSYSQITGAFKINENLNIEEVLNYKIDYELLKIEINNLASTAYYGLINPPFPTNQDKYNENINHLIYAYMNYIDEFLNKNPDYKQNIKNKIDALKIKTQVISSMSVNDDIKACLPDISFFTNKKYKIIDKNKKNKLKYITKKIFYKLFKK